MAWGVTDTNPLAGRAFELDPNCGATLAKPALKTTRWVEQSAIESLWGRAGSDPHSLPDAEHNSGAEGGWLRLAGWGMGDGGGERPPSPAVGGGAGRRHSAPFRTSSRNGAPHSS